MDKFLNRSSSIPNLVSKRAREDAASSSEQWQLPKKFAPSKDAPKDKPTKEPVTNNRFSGLSIDDVITDTFKKATKMKQNSQIPPILVELLGDWSHQNIKTVIEKYEKSFHLQYKGRNRVKVQCYTPSGHQQVKDGLLKENVAFHTFSRKDEKLPKAVIKGLPKFLHASLGAELASIGFAGATVLEIKTLYPSECPPILVQLPTGTDMGKFKQIKYISNCVVDVQKYKPSHKAGTQCFRCQGFGHAARNCNRPARCVKCVREHPTWECPKKDREEPARCCNCDQNHPANFGQCSERLKYLERIKSKRGNSRSAIAAPKAKSSVPLEAPKISSQSPTWADITSMTTRHVHAPKSQEIRTKASETSEIKGKPSTALSTSEVALPTDKMQVHDLATAEMLEILNTIKSLKQEFTKCETFMDKVILILTHLGHYA